MPPLRPLPFAIALLLAASVLAACGGEDTTAPDNPTPGITALSPTEVDRGRADLELTVLGSDFVRTSVVRVNGADRPTQYVSAAELRATLPASDFATGGTVQVLVGNPPPGGGASNVAMLVVRIPPNPVPVVTGFSPEFIAAGSGDTQLTVRGTGFVPTSFVMLGFGQMPTTYVSPTELRVTVPAAVIESPRLLEVSVFSPDPGGGASGTRTIEVRAPAPAITSLGESQTTAGQTGYLLRVNGTGFIEGSVVRFNGAPRATRLVSASVLEATLLEGDLRSAGTFDITVTNPAPGGGTSSARTFTLVNGAPTITLLPVQGANAGRPGFTLVIHGRGFVPGSVVRWNGAERATQYISSTRVAVNVSSADVAGPGTAQVSVSNPAPGGGTSSTATLTVRVPGAATSTVLEVPLLANDLAWDPSSGRLYASVRSASQTNANSVVAIDPATGAITGSTFVGSDPNRLAISEDGGVLYVAIDGANAVRRVALPSLTPGLQWSVGAGLVAEDIEVVPGAPNSVAVSRHARGFSPPLAGVTVYDDGIARPESSPGHTGGARIEFLDSPDRLYGYNNAHTGFEFFTIGIDATGARHLTENGGLISGFYVNIVGASGRIYGTDGSVVDAEQRAKVGTLAAGGNSIAVDATLGRAYVLTEGGIGVYDLNNFQHLGTIGFPTVSFDHPALVNTRLVRWGTDGLAFLDQTRLIIVRSPIVAP